MAKSKDEYEAHRKAQATASRQRSAAGRDIGTLPPVGNPARREECRKSLQRFCETYFPHLFSLAWSPDHIRAIGKLQESATKGGLFAFAMPRGSGKTTLSSVAAVWSLVYAFRRFVVLIGATERHAGELLDSIKIELETNDLLAEDFPEVCYPIRCLEGEARRCNGQTLNGTRTRIEWTQNAVTFPVVEGAKTSGSCLRVAGITGRIRGLKIGNVRPDFVILDDPQTDEAARSPSQIHNLAGVINKAVLGLAGPKVKISAVMPCTVIEPDDLADRFLNRDLSPEWQGERCRMVEKWPDRADLWEQYAEIRMNSLRAGSHGAEATEFYRANFDAMNAGGVVSWHARFNDDELSAIQHAQNLRLRNERMFASEYQNAPLRESFGSGDIKEIDKVAATNRLNNLNRGDCPREATRLVSFIDIGGQLHWYLVLAVNENFGGSVVDYGTWPPQNRTYFTNSEPKPGIGDLPGFGKYSEPQRVFAGLTALTEILLSRTYTRDNLAPLTISQCLIDSGWQTDTVHEFCRQSKHKAIIVPSKGYAVKSGKPVSEWPKRDGERVGHHWRLTTGGAGSKGRLLIFDSDTWKDLAADKLAMALGGSGALTLFGSRSSVHDMFGDHLCAEYASEAKFRGRTFYHWEVRPDKPDNHWLDCLVGCLVAASVAGVRLSSAGDGVDNAPKPKRRKLSEMYAKRQERKDGDADTRRGG